MVGFFDFGLITDDWSKIKEEKFISGIGLGVRIPMPIFESLRIDFGWGIRQKKLRKKPVLHFAIQQKF